MQSARRVNKHYTNIQAVNYIHYNISMSWSHCQLFYVQSVELWWNQDGDSQLLCSVFGNSSNKLCSACPGYYSCKLKGLLLQVSVLFEWRMFPVQNTIERNFSVMQSHSYVSVELHTNCMTYSDWSLETVLAPQLQRMQHFMNTEYVM